MRRHASLLLVSVPLLVLLGFAAAGVATAGGGCHAEVEPIPTEARSATVKIDGCTFAPTLTRVPVGAEVRFVNTSGSPHDVTGRKFEWGSGELSNGETFTYRFRTAGMYPYSCSLHPGMAGIVVVGTSVAADDSDIAPVSATVPAAATSAGDATLPIVAAGGLGVLGGALVAGAIVSRRQRSN